MSTSDKDLSFATDIKNVVWHFVDMSSSLLEFQEVCGVNSFFKLFCPSCSTDERSSHYGYSVDYPGFVFQCCNKCQFIWYHCFFCSSSETTQTSSYRSGHPDVYEATVRNIQHHQNSRKKYHQQQQVPKISSFNIFEDDEFDAESITPGEGFNIFDSYTFDSMRRSENTAFYNLMVNDESWAQHYTFQACFGSTKPDDVSMDLDEVDVHVALATLCSRLTRNDRHILAYALNKMVILSTKRKLIDHQSRKRSKNVDWSCSLPTTYNHIDSRFCRGKYSFLQNLLYPAIFQVDDWAYTSLCDCVAHVLAMGYPIDTISSDLQNSSIIKRVTESPVAQKIHQRAIDRSGIISSLPMYAIIWGDDFEPNYSIKSSRSSVHITTVSICAPRSHVQCGLYTFPLAIGPKHGDTETIESRLREDIQKLSGVEPLKFYHHSVKQNVYVHLEILASLEDQLERRSLNYIALGNSMYTARWGYVLNASKAYNTIRACDSCVKYMECGTEIDVELVKQCKDCSCWMTNIDHPGLRFKVPKHYPIEMLDNSSYVCPKKQTYEFMYDGILTAYAKTTNPPFWNKKKFEQYLRLHGLNAEIIAKAWETSSKQQLFQQLSMSQNKTDSGNKLYEKLRMERKDSPINFQVLPKPSVWDQGVTLEQHVDVICHLLFLGITKSTILLIQDWNCLQNHNDPFVMFCKKATSKVSSLHLSWLPVIPFKGGRIGGWVSENYMAFTRIMKWAYSVLEIISSKDNDSIKNWTIKQCKIWIKRVGEKPPKTNVDGLRKFIRKYIERHPGNYSELLLKQSGSVEDVKRTVSSLNSMISRVMTQESTPSRVKDLDRHIKLFLSYFSSLDARIDPNRKLPTWISCYNFLCLLNLPRNMDMYGPLRNLSELDIQGEGFIQHAKSTITDVYSKHWNYNCMKNIHIQRTMNYFWKKHSGQDIFKSDFETFSSMRTFVKYKSFADVWNKFIDRHPLSVLISQENMIHVVLQTKDIIIFQRISWNCCIFDLHYHMWSMQQYTTCDNLNLDIKNCTPAIMLPQLIELNQEEENKSRPYAIVDNTWKEMNKVGTICLPEISNVLY